MIEEAEILEDDADAASERGQFAPLHRGHILAEEIDEAAGGAQRQEEQAQQG